MRDIQEEKVKVIVRLRPLTEEEKKHGTRPSISASTKKRSVTAIKGHGMQKVVYSFDSVHTAFATQREIFQDSVVDIVDDVMKGYTGTIIAYGQTGTGKTYTTEGDISQPAAYGIIPRSITKIFETLEGVLYQKSRVTCSYLEIYNEELTDLFGEVNNDQKLEIMNDGGGTIVKGLTEKLVKTPDDVLSLIRKAVQYRRIGETKLNKQSSRSHCIFSVNVYLTKNDAISGNLVDYHGKLNMVDLAGSECAKAADLGSRSHPSSSERERERKNINKSLLTLGRVITAVRNASQGNKSIRIPYRDSKLTRVLQNAIGGTSKTVIIATVSPADSAISESISTLNYAQAANGIVNKPIIDSKQKLSKNFKATENTTPDNSVQQWYDLECKLKYMEAQLEEAQSALARKNQQQQVLIDRVGFMEKEVMKKEKIIKQAVEKIDSMDRMLEKERKEKRKVVEELEKKQIALTKTEALLMATRETERKLTEEAKDLIAAVELSVDDTTKFHEMIEHERKEELVRKQATSELQRNSIDALKNIEKKLNLIPAQEKEIFTTLVQESNKEAKLNQESLVKIVNVLKDINSDVKTFLDDAKNRDLSALAESHFRSVQNEVRETKSMIDKTISTNKSENELYIQRLENTSKEIEKRHSNTKKQAQDLMSTMTSRIEKSSKNISGMAERMMDSVSTFATSISTTRQALCDLINDMEKQTKSSMNMISESSVSQSLELKNVVELLNGSIQGYNEARVTLEEENKLLSQLASDQHGDIMRQKDLFVQQKQIFESAYEYQKEMHSMAIERVMSGVQNLLSSEFGKLNEANEKRMHAMLMENNAMIQINEKIDETSRRMVNGVHESNSKLASNIEILHSNDVQVMKQASSSREIFERVKAEAENQKNDVMNVSRSFLSKMDQISSYENDALSNLVKVDESKQQLLSEQENLNNFVTSSVTKLVESHSKTEEMITEMIVPETIGVLSGKQKADELTFSDISNRMNNLELSSLENKEKVTSVAAEISAATQNLQNDIIGKCSSFHKATVTTRKRDIESHRVKFVEQATTHIKSLRTSSKSAHDSCKMVYTDLDSYAKKVIRVQESTRPAEDMVTISYNKKLSTTPPDHVIFASLHTDDHSEQDENRNIMITTTAKSELKRQQRSPDSPIKKIYKKDPMLYEKK